MGGVEEIDAAGDSQREGSQCARSPCSGRAHQKLPASSAAVGPIRSRAVAATLVQVLKQCGDNLTRENVMKQAANLKNLRVDVLLPGIMINTGPTDFAPIESLQLMHFNGHQWVLSGEIMGR